jgi:hypothetical protein
VRFRKPVKTLCGLARTLPDLSARARGTDGKMNEMSVGKGCGVSCKGQYF